jgi:phage-related protein
VDAKPLSWVGSSRDDLRAMPPDVRHELGFDLRRVQTGGLPRDWKPMAQVGSGVSEIRVRLAGAYRVLYVAKFPEAVYVLHVFRKKSQQTTQFDLDLGRRRYATVMRARSQDR